VSRQAVSRWLKAWDKKGLAGLVDRPRSGRPRKLSAAQEEQVLETLEQEPRSIKRVLAELGKRFGKKIGVATIRKLCKRAGLSWKRMRKSLKGKRNPKAFEESKERLAELLEREARGEIDLHYFDESGFTLVPCVPYAWQPVGETIRLPTSHSKRLNVLGFMTRDSEFHSYVFEGTVDASVVVACFNDFAQTLEKDVVVVLDNSPLHTSREFMQNLEDWDAKGLKLEFIAPYSPELNLIEILWRKIKYEWLPFSAYDSFSSLREKLTDILRNIGTEYRVEFA
jgi:transposase